MEHDIRYPGSHALALEFLLLVLTDHNVPPADLLDGAAAWVERWQEPAGSLRNPPELLDYPRAPWWQDGGQTIPAAITGMLIRLGKASPDLRAATLRWAQVNLTPEQIRANGWLFMCYHAFHYCMNETDLPDLDAHRTAAVENIIACAEKAEPNQAYELFRFAPTPDSPVARALPSALLTRFLDDIEAAQGEDGGWNDEHGLPQWRPYVTIGNLAALRAYGRDIGTL